MADLTLVTARAGRHDRQPRAGSADSFRHLEFGVPDENFLDRVLRFREKLAALLRAERFHLIHFRSIWEGVVAAALEIR